MATGPGEIVFPWGAANEREFLTANACASFKPRAVDICKNEDSDSKMRRDEAPAMAGARTHFQDTGKEEEFPQLPNQCYIVSGKIPNTDLESRNFIV